MQTDTNVDDMLRMERRKVFHVMNGLPCLLLVLVMAGISFHSYRQYYYTLNSVAATSTKEMVVPTNDIPVAVTNNEVLLTETIEDQTKKVYEEALLDFQINAVSNNRAEWMVNVRGEILFQWKDVIITNVVTNVVMNVITNVVTNIEPTVKSIHGIPLPPAREYPFTVSNWELSREINLNIEEEITKIVISTVQAHFIAKRSVDDQDFKKNLQIDLARQIERFFDGFETLNKENIRR